MGLYKHLKKTFRNKKSLKPLMRERLIKWRKDNAITRIEHPSNLISARRLGYRAKSGFILVRVRLKRGGKKRPSIKKGRRPKHSRQKFVMGKNYQWVAEERVCKKFPNLEVLNSYNVGKDGKHYFFEIILVDPNSSVIKTDPKINWICEPKHRGRVFRGKTSAGRKSRGLLRKGRGTEKIRPSLRAHGRRGK